MWIIVYTIFTQRLQRACDCGFQSIPASGLDEQHHLVLDCAGTNPETGGFAFMDGLKCVGKSGALMFVGTYSEYDSFLGLKKFATH
jgi:threonine dehydrogenase-like Zn-dependent dehydrogenase